jgi:hypothetical protein
MCVFSHAKSTAYVCSGYAVPVNVKARKQKQQSVGRPQSAFLPQMTLVLLPRDTRTLTKEVEESSVIAVVGAGELKVSGDPAYLTQFLIDKFALPAVAMQGYSLRARQRASLNP